jgi:hypothetical protein
MLRKEPLTSKEETFIAALIKQLVYTDKMEKTASILGAMGEDAIPALAGALKGNTALGAALALGRTKSQKAVPILIKALKSDKRFFVRTQAAISLGNIISSKSIGPLIHALNKDKKVHVRVAAAESLGNMIEAGKLSMKQIIAVQTGVKRLILPLMRVKPLSLYTQYGIIVEDVRSKISKAMKKAGKTVPIKKKY